VLIRVRKRDQYSNKTPLRCFPEVFPDLSFLQFFWLRFGSNQGPFCLMDVCADAAIRLTGHRTTVRGATVKEFDDARIGMGTICGQRLDRPPHSCASHHFCISLDFLFMSIPGSLKDKLRSSERHSAEFHYKIGCPQRVYNRCVCLALVAQRPLLCPCARVSR